MNPSKYVQVSREEVDTLRNRLWALDEQRDELRRALLHALTRNHGSSEGCHECALIDKHSKDT